MLSNDDIGLGIRPIHYHDILHSDHKIKWFEAITENYLDTKGNPLRILEAIRDRFPLALHGVSLSLGSEPFYKEAYLKNLRELVHIIEPIFVTDHLCFSAGNKHSSHDLLPFPLTKDSFDHVCKRILEVEEILCRPIGIENISQYITTKLSTWEETDFLNELCKKTGCFLLLDVNNVYVNSYNFGFDPFAYIKRIDPEHVKQFHLAGFSKRDDYLFDTHIGPIPKEVLKLFEYTIKHIGPRHCLLEWDEEIPSFAQLCQEAEKITESAVI